MVHRGCGGAARLRVRGALYGIAPSAYMQVVYAIRRATPTGDFVIEDWNDAPDGTQQDVLAVLAEVEEEWVGS